MTSFSERVEQACAPLRPLVEKDEQGAHRVVFSAAGASFAFKAREELPIYPTLASSRVGLFGSKPNLVPDAERSAWIQRLGDSGADHFVVDRTVDDVLALGRQLGVAVPQRDEAFDVMDSIVALDWKLRQESSLSSTYAEATVLLAFAGDSAAQELVGEARKELYAETTRRREARASKANGASPLKVEALVGVHATSHLPKRVEGGGWSVGVFHDVNPTIERGSLHVTLNHVVEDHLYGGWSGARHVLVAQLDDLIEENGVQLNLNTVDTWWEVSPGQQVGFRDATLVTPGSRPGGPLITPNEDGSEIRYKAYNFSGKDVDAVLAIRSATPHAASTPVVPDISQIIYSDEKLHSIYKDSVREFPKRDDVSKRFLEVCRERPNVTIADAMNVAIGELPAGNGTAVEIGAARDQFIKRASEHALGTLAVSLRNAAVAQAIESRGARVERGGEWAWGDAWQVTDASEALAAELGSGASAHSSTPESSIETAGIHAIGASRDRSREGEPFVWTSFRPDDQVYDRGLLENLRISYDTGTNVDSIVAEQRPRPNVALW
jgi:hypothetical protein